MKLYNQIELSSLLSKNPVILECGSNIGTDTLCMLKDYPNAQLHCFEPDPRNIITFKEATAEYNDRCTLHEIAIANEDGFIQFHQSYGRSPSKPQRDHVYSSTIKDPKPQIKLHPWLKYKEPIQVKVMKFDTWLKTVNIPTIDFMWTDVEGAEEEVILGGTELLKRLHYLYIEYNDFESYGGRITSTGILRLLPKYKLIKKWSCDMLLCNEQWQ
ncbi:MAG: FkbM family methyltransferase [Actinobacteria bacterium]|nr:FkbM family methyltransferase [Actinomycetota bacterium]